MGCLIYVLFRTDALIYNRLLGNIFTPLTSPVTFLEKVFVFSLPGGLWAMSYTLLIFHIRKDKTFSGQWVFSVFNAYNRQNAANIRFQKNIDTGQNEAVRLSIFGIIPSVTYNFKF